MYKNLEIYFLKIRDSQIKKLKDYEQRENELVPIRKLLDCVTGPNINFEEIKSLIKIINSNELNNLIHVLDLTIQLKVCAKDIDNNIETVDINMLKKLFSSSSIISDEQKGLLDTLSTVKDTYAIIKTPNFGDEEFKNIILELKGNLVNSFNIMVDNLFYQIKNHIETFCNSILVKKMARVVFFKKECEREIHKIDRYISLFDESGVKNHFASIEEMNNFYEEIKYSSLNEEEKLGLVLAFSKYNINYYNRLVDIRNLNIKNQVKKNTDEVLESMEKLVPTPPEIEVKTEQPFALILSEEEKEILNQVKKVITMYFTSDNYDADFLEMFKDNYSMSREGFYFDGDKLNWSVIATDVKYILEPNLNDNSKKQIFDRFKYILEVIKSYEKNQQEIQKRIDSIKSISSKISNIIESRSGQLNYFENLKRQHDYCEKICSWIKEGNFESVKQYLQYIDQPLVFFEYFVILQDLNDYNICVTEDISLFASDENTYNQMIDDIEKLLLLEKEKSIGFDEYFNSLYGNDKNEDSTEIDYSDNKNLVYYMFDDFNLFDEDQRAELQEATRVLLNVEWYKLKNINNFLNDLYYTKQNGKKVHYQKDGLDARRIWAKNGTRTGVIKIDICEENQKKIFDRYGLNGMNSLILVTGVIHSIGSDHDEYDILTGFIDKNMDRINNIREIFANPNSDEKEMFDIVDKALRISNKVSQGNFTQKQIG